MRQWLGMVLIAAAAFAASAAHAQNTLTMDAPAGTLIDGGRIFDANPSNAQDSTTYGLGTGRSVSVALGAPHGNGYNLAVLQTVMAVFGPQCGGTETRALSCVRGDGASCAAVSSGCIASLAARGRYTQCNNADDNTVKDCRSGYNPQACAKLPGQCLQQILSIPRLTTPTNQGACNSNIVPVDKQIKLSLSCGSNGFCGCSIAVGRQVPWEGHRYCPYTCQTYNSMSRSCIGPAMNGC